jgi:hypothetical protein
LFRGECDPFDWVDILGRKYLRHARHFTISVGYVYFGLSTWVEQSHEGRVLRLASLKFLQNSHRYPLQETIDERITGEDTAALRQQLQEALDFLASDIDLDGNSKMPGLLSNTNLFRNFYR